MDFPQCSLYRRVALFLIYVLLFSRVENLLPLEGVCCEPGTYSILSYSSRQLKVWYIMQLYAQVSNIGSPSMCLQVTSHPLVPMRVIATCADSAVRLVSPVTGDVLTTALLPLERTILSTCYFPFNGMSLARASPSEYCLERSFLTLTCYSDRELL